MERIGRETWYRSIFGGWLASLGCIQGVEKAGEHYRLHDLMNTLAS
jgi:hypothetical protein